MSLTFVSIWGSFFVEVCFWACDFPKPNLDLTEAAVSVWPVSLKLGEGEYNVLLKLS